MTACCVLLDVTARCDQHCPWCFARAERAGADGGEPSLGDIERWYDRLVELGEERPFNIQLSGGEPAVRGDLPEIISLGRAKGFDYIQLNTNGRRLGADAADGETAYGGGEYGEAFARRLAGAGLTTVFMQFDGMSDIVYNLLRGEPLLDVKLRAIDNCAKAGLPVTLVPTIVRGVNIFEADARGKVDGGGRADGAGAGDAADAQGEMMEASGTGEIGAMVDFMLSHLGVVKGIHFQPASFFGRYPSVEMSGDGVRSVINPDRVTMFAVMDEIEKQTGGRIRKSDLLPITTGHPLCCFCANFLRETNGKLTSMATEAQREGGMACCDEVADARGGSGADCCNEAADARGGSGADCCGEAADTRGGSGASCCGGAEDSRGDGLRGDASCCCAPAPNPLEIIRRDRDFVLNKWQSPSEGAAAVKPPGDRPMSFDEALDWLRGNIFTISGMAFMDGSNLDAERLKRCRVQYYTKDDRLIPFCAYNSMYREHI
jgi:uncharacterized radical SAM superfamily Fe-S cluster-containing enzyme